MKLIVTAFLLIISGQSFADWHSGKIKHIGIGYDRATITVALDGWNRSNCSCYPTWNTYMCLDSTRQTHDFEKSLILAARARGSVVKINIEETTCKVTAVYEDNG